MDNRRLVPMEAEEYANFRVQADMSSEAFALVYGILQAHAEEHPEDRTVLSTIKFERIQ
jgi:hypothetical protein